MFTTDRRPEPLAAPAASTDTKRAPQRPLNPAYLRWATSAPLAPAASVHVARKETGAAAAADVTEAPRSIETVLSAGRGQPLDPGTRARFEPLLGMDLAAVRVHTHADAAASAADVGASA